MTDTIKGSCLCGAVTFKIRDDFQAFNFCHCAQCHKTTGAAFASNLKTATDNIEWLTGKELVKRYDVPGREIRTEFCSNCGCNVPYVNHSRTWLIVPAGSLESAPKNTGEKQIIFWPERHAWFDHMDGTEKFDGFRE